MFKRSPGVGRFIRHATLTLSSAAAINLSIDLSALAEQPAVLPAVKVEGDQLLETEVINLAKPASTGKRRAPLHEIPASVAVVDSTFITESGAKNIQDALLYSSGVYAGAYGFDTRGDWTTVRGLDASNYQDGLRSIYGYYNNARTNVYSLEQIEVLKGPSSALYGQSELGGIVNAISKRPKAEAAGEVWAQVGSFDRRQLAADVTGPLTDDGKWLYRLVALSRDSGTQVDHVDDDGWFLLPSITWRPSDATSATLLINHQEDRGQVSAQFLPSRGTIDTAPRGRLDTDTFVGEPGWDRYDIDRTDITLFVDQALTDNWLVSLTARKTWSEAETREHWADIPLVPDDAGNISRTIYQTDKETDVESFDLRLEGTIDLGITRHRLAFGVDYQDALWEEDNYFYGGGLGGVINLYNPVYGNLQSGVITPTDRPDNTVEQTGLYLIDHMEIGNVIVSGSLRRDDSESTILGVAPDPDFVREDKETSVHLGVMYKFANGFSPYISYTDAFIPNLGTDGVGGGLAPTTGEQKEAGFKYLSPAQDLSIAFAWFDIEQEQRVVQGDQPGSFSQTGAVVDGWELEIKKQWRQLSLIANYTRFEASDESTDTRLSAVAEKMASAWASYEVGNGLRFGLGARYTGDVVGYGGAPSIDAVTLVDAMVGYGWGAWDFSVDAKNLTDEVYVSWCRYQGADCGYGERRVVNGNVRYRF